MPIDAVYAAALIGILIGAALKPEGGAEVVARFIGLAGSTIDEPYDVEIEFDTQCPTFWYCA